MVSVKIHFLGDSEGAAPLLDHADTALESLVQHSSQLGIVDSDSLCKFVYIYIPILVEYKLIITHERISPLSPGWF